MKFEFYVLNYDCNRHKVEMFNVFRNINVQESTEKEIKKYLRAPSKYVYKDYHRKDNDKFIEYYGFEAFVKELNNIIKWQEWGRREYEISVGDAFEYDCNKFEKWDCYQQAKPNMEIIAREVIYQYKQQVKGKNNISDFDDSRR